MTPVRRIKRVAEVGHVDKLDSGRRLPAEKPSSRNHAGRGIFHDEITQSASADQLTVRLAHYRELTEVRALVGHQHPFDPRTRVLGRIRRAVPEVSTDLRHGMDTREEVAIVGRNPAQDEPVGLDPISAWCQRHQSPVTPHGQIAVNSSSPPRSPLTPHPAHPPLTSPPPTPP